MTEFFKWMVEADWIGFAVKVGLALMIIVGFVRCTFPGVV